jgi:L-ascorbate metabolism protein UlaG (beta-lactamase superfamily)
MDIERKGGNCVVISTKKYTFVIDPKLSDKGLKDQGSATAQLLTESVFAAAGNDETVVIDGPGEYEVQNCSVKGIAARPHSQPDSAPKTDLEAIGVVDILILPVGGYGYSIEPKEAVELVRTIEPKVVIPTHYSEEGVTYEVPQGPLEDFLKELGAKHEEPTPKLKLKAGMLPESLTVYEITRTK